jgi:hypothetical protein
MFVLRLLSLLLKLLHFSVDISSDWEIDGHRHSQVLQSGVLPEWLCTVSETSTWLDCVDLVDGLGGGNGLNSWLLIFLGNDGCIILLNLIHLLSITEKITSDDCVLVANECAHGRVVRGLGVIRFVSH